MSETTPARAAAALLAFCVIGAALSGCASGTSKSPRDASRFPPASTQGDGLTRAASAVQDASTTSPEHHLSRPDTATIDALFAELPESASLEEAMATLHYQEVVTDPDDPVVVFFGKYLHCVCDDWPEMSPQEVAAKTETTWRLLDEEGFDCSLVGCALLLGSASDILHDSMEFMGFEGVAAMVVTELTFEPEEVPTP